uniref:Uncharacterized protein LOC111105761 n=1 Tax=Crassostrea virginica TaxID=6565 RepID=A0A8B8AXF6_CRAVI|nr:uncharacterized protein LOC111105761 [Crassostrea virginica]
MLPGIVLLACGLFSPYWVNYKSNNITSECYRGVISNSGCPDGISGLGVTILGLEATSFTVVVFTTIACLALICWNDNSDDDNDEDSDGDSGCCTLFGGFLICLYPIAGIIGFAGCMVVVSEFKDHSKGWAFYVSLVASLLIILQIIICCCIFCVNCKDEKNSTSQDRGDTEPASQPTSYTISAESQPSQKYEVGKENSGYSSGLEMMNYGNNQIPGGVVGSQSSNSTEMTSHTRVENSQQNGFRMIIMRSLHVKTLVVHTSYSSQIQINYN